MKKDKNKEKNIEFVVLNFFIRIIKSDGKYLLYRRGVNNTGIMGYLLKQNGRHMSDNPFASASSTAEVAQVLERITNDMAKNNGKRGGIKDLDKYEHVTMTINHLLHFFIESAGVSMDKLCSMGEEIYNLSCHKLFGDTLEELGEQKKEELETIRDIGQLKAKLFHDYVSGLKDGTIEKSVSFEQFLKKNKGVLDKFKTTAKDISSEFNQGHALGRMPDDGNGFTEAIGSIDGRRGWLDGPFYEEDEMNDVWQ